ncbi:hypothetical protein ACIOWF_20100 [Cellulosimicrobium cellulans]|uniref:hypothetical protein n=1 Tax=Cellulosimicrobium cellulans TaxID=1710 RepID=UPI00380CDF75
MEDFVRDIGTYANRVERAHWRSLRAFSKAVVDTIAPLRQAVAAEVDANRLYLTVHDLYVNLRARGDGPGPRARAAAAVADDLELALSGWRPGAERGVRDQLLARAFRCAEPLDDPDHDPRRAWVSA